MRRVWGVDGSRPVAIVTGSHRHSCVFGALSHDGRQLFREYDSFNEETFLDFLKHILYKFKRCFIFLDKAPAHYKSEMVREYFAGHAESLIPIWLPTASPEFMPLEECWNISKNDLLTLTYHSSFSKFRRRVGEYFRSKRFNLDIRRYLLTESS